MTKTRKRQAFATPATQDKSASARPEKLIDTSSGVFAFFRDHGVRETIESILIAVVLALMFRAYEAEAFIIPTGSMAPSLQGQHMDVVCEQCGYQYRAGASNSASNVDPLQQGMVTKTYCPICRFGMNMQQRNPDHQSNNGDRILVNKFVYDFQAPERFDVIVFKNPNNGKQNYIKRLIGLPGDRILIENGDIFNVTTGADGQLKKEIVRKPIDKIDAMLQLVDDTNHIPHQFQVVDWPSRWNEWGRPDTAWKVNESDGTPFFAISSDNDQMRWLRYRHLAPRSAFDEFVFEQVEKNRVIGGNVPPTEWEQIESGQIPDRIQNDAGQIAPGALIRDYYEYNDRRVRYRQRAGGDFVPEHLSWASHWVGDLAFDSELVIDSDGGELGLDLVEGGVHFKCIIDIASGQATITAEADGVVADNVQFDTANNEPPTAKTNLQGSGSYKIRYANIDNMVYLWINGRYVDFQGSSYQFKNAGRPVPQYGESDPADAEPIGIGAANASVRVNRLKVFRDIYYVAPVAIMPNGDADIRNETGTDNHKLILTYENPQLWSSDVGRRIFQRPSETGPIFELADGQYFPMGDNSPASQDARIWGDDHYVDEDYLIGRAMFIYWPHSLNSPVKYFPNFRRMGFIR